MLRSLFKFLLLSLSGFSALATLILFRRDYFHQTNSEGVVAIAFVGFFAVFFFILCGYLLTRWGRNIRYGHMLTCLNHGFSHIHASTRNPNATSDTIMKAVENLCHSVATAFSVVTGSPCAVTVKLLSTRADVDPSVRIRVVTMCRNSESAPQREYTGDHWLDANTDFISILKNITTPRGRYFFSNRLPWRENYSNTSFDVYGGAPKAANVPLWREFIRYWRWPLPYKSTVCRSHLSRNKLGEKNRQLDWLPLCRQS